MPPRLKVPLPTFEEVDAREGILTDEVVVVEEMPTVVVDPDEIEWERDDGEIARRFVVVEEAILLLFIFIKVEDEGFVERGGDEGLLLLLLLEKEV